MLYQENFKTTAEAIENIGNLITKGVHEENDITHISTLYLSGIYALMATISRSLAILADEAVAERKERETKADEVLKNLLEVDHERDKREEL
ncbi:MAG: hypothetical protein VZR54_07040 [Ruminococcus sp.]|nr:hypothetical protein [Ruminococcus sp.]